MTQQDIKIEVNGSARTTLENFQVIEKSESITAGINNDLDIRLARLEAESQFNDQHRGESYRAHIHRIVVIGMYMAASVLMIMIGIWGWHLLMPEKFRWLSLLELQGVERIIFSSVIFSFATKYFKKFKIIERD